jgi:hypothetical protein
VRTWLHPLAGAHSTSHISFVAALACNDAQAARHIASLPGFQAGVHQRKKKGLKRKKKEQVRTTLK